MTDYRLEKMCEKRGAFTRVFRKGKWVADFNKHTRAETYVELMTRPTTDQSNADIAREVAVYHAGTVCEGVAYDAALSALQRVRPE